MKKLTAILVALMMLLALAGCHAKKPAADTAATTATSEKGHQSDAEKARGYYYYEAIFLDKDEVLNAFKQAAPDYPKNDLTPPEFHVTTAFQPEEKHTSLYGTKVTVHIVGYASGTVHRDDGAGESSNEGFLVELSTDNEEMQALLDSYDKVWHITGSYSAEGYYTEYLDWSKTTPMDITVTGTFGGADSDENFFTTPE
ncbi:MAG: hypothetical protein Q4C07_06070 [Eubacteriales bacterium]|nr:hypothetical protein [Eubacteriales bacterium]